MSTRLPPLGSGVLALGALLVVFGCDLKPRTRAPEPAPASREPFTIDEPFPTEAKLRRVAERPAPAPESLFGPPTSAVDTWTMHGPGASTLEARAYDGDDVVGTVAAEVLAADPRGRRATAGMQCLAEQFGRFALAHGARPAPDIAAFMAARCGTLVWHYRTGFGQRPADALPPEAMEPESLRSILADAVRQLPPDDVEHVGLWLGRNDQRSVNVSVMGRPDVELRAPIPLNDGPIRYVDIRARARWDFVAIQGTATRGALGVARCRRIPGITVSAPEIALRCPVDPEDETSMIELSANPPGRVLWRPLLRVLVSPRGEMPETYRAPSLSLPRDGARADLGAGSIAAGINHVRAAAQQASTSVSLEQTQLVEELGPHFLAAINAPDQAALADELTLGLIAGHRVNATIRSGSLFSTNVPASWSVERELAAVLASPLQRAHLLDPDASEVAIASISDRERDARRSIIVSYQTFDDADYTAEISAFFDAVDRQRAVVGLEPVIRAGGAKDRAVLDAAARRVREGERHPEEALGQLVRHFAEQNGRNFQGVMFFPFRLEGWDPELDGALVTARKVAAAVTITHVVPEDAAWGRQLVMVVFTVL